MKERLKTLPTDANVCCAQVSALSSLVGWITSRNSSLAYCNQSSESSKAVHDQCALCTAFLYYSTFAQGHSFEADGSYIAVCLRHLASSKQGLFDISPVVQNPPDLSIQNRNYVAVYSTLKGIQERTVYGSRQHVQENKSVQCTEASHERLKRWICTVLVDKRFTTGCLGGNVPDFGRMFLMLKYTDITQNTYIRS